MVGRTLQFPKGSIVAVDRGYNDYSWYKQLNAKGIFFVTRLKSMRRCVLLRADLPAAGRCVARQKNVMSDQTIKFTGVRT